MAARSDSPSVGNLDNVHLRKFLLARRAGDAVEMRRWWEELVIDFHDRMDGLVAVTHKGRLDDFEHEEAVQRAMVRFSDKLMGSFEGTSMGELVNATKQLCWYACVDVQQAAAKHRRGLVPLEAGDADDDRPSPTWEADAAREAFQNDEAERDLEAFLAWALPQVLESRRGVVERTFAGVPLAEICIEFDLTRENAYQRRSRGLKDLAKLHTEYDA